MQMLSISYASKNPVFLFKMIKASFLLFEVVVCRKKYNMLSQLALPMLDIPDIQLLQDNKSLRVAGY